MTAIRLNDVLELADQLPQDEQALLIEALRRRQADSWRRQLLDDADQAEIDLRAGRLKVEPHEQMKARLRGLLGHLDE